MPRTTLASRIFRPIQSSPLKVVLVRTGTTRGTLIRSPSAIRRASPPVALLNALSTSIVEVTSANSRGFAGPTFVSAVSLPSVARQRPSSLAVVVARQSPGSTFWSSIGRVSPVGRSERHLVDGVGHRLALHGDIAAVHDQPQSFFLQVGLLHEPMGQSAQQVEVRPAAFVAPRP